MLIQIHALQSLAASAVNRGKDGSPKNMFFGGVPRLRISSQAQKRAIRMSDVFASAFDSSLLSKRTRSLPALLKDHLLGFGASENEIEAILSKVANEMVKKAKEEKEPGAEDGKDDAMQEKETDEVTQTGQLIFMTNQEIAELAKQIWDAFKRNPKVNFGKAIQGVKPKAVDLALFGRMTTSEAFVDTESAVQVAHAFSVSQGYTTTDYFTAVDDLGDGNGAAMIGESPFSAAVYYKYANIHFDRLVANLEGDKELALLTVETFINGFCYVLPGGKQNSYASFTPCDFVLLELSKKNIPAQYANAFLKPVEPAGVLQSSTVLAGYINQIDTAWGLNRTRYNMQTGVFADVADPAIGQRVVSGSHLADAIRTYVG